MHANRENKRSNIILFMDCALRHMKTHNEKYDRKYYIDK